MSESKIKKRGVRYKKPYDFAPVPVFDEDHKRAGQPRCTAWSRTAGRQCTNPPEKNRTKCRLHGGLTPRGPANASYKHGKYSKSLPTKLALHYEAARKDENLISLREEIALVDVRLQDLLNTLRTDGDSLATWKNLKTSLYRYRTTKDPDMKGVYLSEILDTIEEGASQAAIWEDLFTALNQRNRLVSTEYKRLVQYGHMMNVEQAMSLLGKVLSIIKEFVDADKFSKIGRELERLVLSRTGEESDARRIGSYLPAPRASANNGGQDISEAVEVGEVGEVGEEDTSGD